MDRSRSRAQLILVAGVGIAVTFVALALILNTVVYTENLATRQGVDGQDAIVFERAAEDGVGGLVSQLNYYDYESYKGIHSSLDESVAAWENESAWSEASRGTAVSVGVTRVTNGAHIVQESERNFTSAGGNTNWTLVNDSTGTRRFRMNVLTSALNTLDTSPFTVVVDTQSKGTWRVSVGQDTESKVAVSGPTSGTCTRSAGSNLIVDLTGGTVEGTECDPLTTIPWENATYSIAYGNADSVQGRYTLIVDDPISSSSFTSPPYSGTFGENPYVVRAIYDATLNLSVQSEKLSYTSTVEVAPERPAGGETYEVDVGTRAVVFSPTAGNLSYVWPDGTVIRTSVPVSEVEAIGPRQVDLDGDGYVGIPYVDSSNTLRIVDANSNHELATDAVGSTTLLGIGKWRGETSVYYVNSTNYLYRVGWNTDTDTAVRRQRYRSVGLRSKRRQ
ncbi:DUF7261 family protein [Halospeciosus flavus]|uniref:DUF7261 family protein n=1 Tax=Halospeciosus flavus TaxID=3032283 RepID=UPI0036233B7F